MPPQPTSAVSQDPPPPRRASVRQKKKLQKKKFGPAKADPWSRQSPKKKIKKITPPLFSSKASEKKITKKLAVKKIGWLGVAFTYLLDRGFLQSIFQERSLLGV